MIERIVGDVAYTVGYVMGYTYRIGKTVIVDPMKKLISHIRHN